MCTVDILQEAALREAFSHSAWNIISYFRQLSTCFKSTSIKSFLYSVPQPSFFEISPLTSSVQNPMSFISIPLLLVVITCSAQGFWCTADKCSFWRFYGLANLPAAIQSVGLLHLKLPAERLQMQSESWELSFIYPHCLPQWSSVPPMQDEKKHIPGRPRLLALRTALKTDYPIALVRLLGLLTAFWAMLLLALADQLISTEINCNSDVDAHDDYKSRYCLLMLSVLKYSFY